MIHTFGAAPGNRTLVVFIHGDGTKGGPSDYLDKSAEKVAGGGVTAVALIRPGYYDSHDATSTGTSYRHAGDGYRDEIVAAVAAAIDEVKDHHRARRVVLAGRPGPNGDALHVVDGHRIDEAADLGAVEEDARADR